MTEPEHDSLSRRSLVKTAAATAAAVGGAMMLAGPAAAAETAPGAATRETPAADASGGAASGDVVVHVRDAATGELDVYTPTGHRDVTDPALAARLIRLAR